MVRPTHSSIRDRLRGRSLPADDEANEEASMSTPPDAAPKRSNAYELFILVLTVLSLVIMVGLVLSLSAATIQLLIVYDNLICVVFLFDFAVNLKRSKRKSDYFIGRRGWLDLVGSVPSLGFFRFTALLRLARLSRLTRITRRMRGKRKRELVKDVVEHRGEYAAFVTVLLAFIVLTLSSILVLQFESKSPDANIKTGGGALWWGVVTITTVGYGDEFPVTTLGRITAVLVMFSGVGIIGALASILASILVPPPIQEEQDRDTASHALRDDLIEIKNELAQLRRVLADRGPDPPGS
jgi:voltage-gated potassium channel